MSPKYRVIASGSMPLANMDQTLTVAIGISYYTSPTVKFQKYYQSLFLKLGDTVVLIALPPEGLPLHMFSRMLIALLFFPMYIRLSLSAPDATTLSTMALRSFRKILKKYINVAWHSLMRRLIYSAALMLPLNRPCVFGATYTPDVSAFLAALSMAYLNVIQSMRKPLTSVK